MDKRWCLVLLLPVLACASRADSGRARKITTLEDSAEHAKCLGTPQALTGASEAGTGPLAQGTSSNRAAAQVGVKNVVVTWAEQSVTNRGNVVQSTVILVSFDATFHTALARCRQPVFQAKGQVQHADTTRSKLSGGVASPYNASLPADVVDATTIPATSKVELRIPARAGDKVLYLAIQTTDSRTILWEQGRELRDSEPAGKPAR